MRNLTAAPTEFLSVEEQAVLIAAAQDVAVEISTDAEGEEVVRYGRTAASEAAMERLTVAFMPAILKAARGSKAQDEEDALGTVLVEFVDAVRRFDLTSKTPFSATISTILARIVSDTDRTSDIIVVREYVAALYWRLLHKHDGDLAAAYAECKATSENGRGLSAATFLAVHNIIGGLASIDPIVAADDSEGGSRYIIAATDGHEAMVVDAAQIEGALASVSEQEAQIVRLAYGFCDTATENLRVANGFKIGETLSDQQISGCLPLGRATVNRRRLAALAAMKEYLLADEEV